MAPKIALPVLRTQNTLPMFTGHVYIVLTAHVHR